jgi:hypothetical protein
VFLGQNAVQDDTERPSGQHDDAHCERELLRIHDTFPGKATQQDRVPITPSAKEPLAPAYSQ